MLLIFLCYYFFAPLLTVKLALLSHENFNDATKMNEAIKKGHGNYSFTLPKRFMIK